MLQTAALMQYLLAIEIALFPKRFARSGRHADEIDLASLAECQLQLAGREQQQSNQRLHEFALVGIEARRRRLPRLIQQRRTFR